MRVAIICLLISTPLTSAKAEAPKVKEVVTRTTAQQAQPERRCAYIGRAGSFHIVGNGGTAAYRLGTERFVADLAFAGQDSNYWYYKPVKKGDQFTTMWAFALRPNCGKRMVWRQDRSGWHRYEATDSWGEGFDVQSASALDPPVAEQIDLRFQKLEKRVSDLENPNGQ